VPRRGASEKFYRAKAVAYFSDEEWAELELDERREISRVVAQSLVVQIEGAMMAGTFDSRTNRWLLWEPVLLDERGWSEMATAIAALHAEVKHIRLDAEERINAEDDAATTIRSTFGIALFESPEVPEPIDVDAPGDRTG
jgi:hypothetical protein